jgi:hypothetical protein
MVAVLTKPVVLTPEALEPRWWVLMKRTYVFLALTLAFGCATLSMAQEVARDAVAPVTTVVNSRTSIELSVMFMVIGAAVSFATAMTTAAAATRALTLRVATLETEVRSMQRGTMTQEECVRRHGEMKEANTLALKVAINDAAQQATTAFKEMLPRFIRQIVDEMKAGK